MSEVILEATGLVKSFLKQNESSLTCRIKFVEVL
jgi:replication initiation and membrane attachment protein DnaB